MGGRAEIGSQCHVPEAPTLFFFFLKFIYLERDRACLWGRGRERERRRERIRADDVEPDAGLEPTNP